MPIDIHWPNEEEPDYGSEEFNQALIDFINTTVNEFLDSDEALAIGGSIMGSGPWSEDFLDLAVTYTGSTLADMDVSDVAEVLHELFPRKITFADPAEADDVIPEMIAFWQYLERQYELANARAIILWLMETEAEFPGIMNDSDNFGMGKSFATLGAEAGYDLSDPEQLQAWVARYNEGLDGGLAPAIPGPGAPHGTKPGANRGNKKSKAKMAKKSRRKNRRKKK
jgi:hypothetical protein